MKIEAKHILELPAEVACSERNLLRMQCCDFLLEIPPPLLFILQ